MKNEKIHDTFNRVLHQYKLKEPVDVDKYLYLKKRERAMYKNILRQAGRYSFWMGIVYAFMQLLPRLGIKATFVKAVAALAAAVSIGTFAVYQGASTVISAVTSAKGKTECNGADVVPVQTQVAAKSFVKDKPQSPVKKAKQKTAPVYRQSVGVAPFITYPENKRYSRMLAKQFTANLPGKHFRLLRTPADINKYTTKLVKGKLYHNDDTYALYISVTSNRGTKFYTRSYTFNDYNHLNSILKKAALDLSNELF